MKFKTVRTVYIVCTLTELALFTAAFWADQPAKTGFGIALLTVLVLNAIFSFKYVRCPHCGSLLNRVVFITCCPYCGEDLDAPPKGGNFD